MTRAKLEWWDAANDRRQQLIQKKWMSDTVVTDAECLELLLLQKLAEMVVDYDTDLLILEASKNPEAPSGPLSA